MSDETIKHIATAVVFAITMIALAYMSRGE